MNKLFKYAATAFFLALIAYPARVNAQSPADTDDTYLRETYTTRPFSDADWDKATKGLGYTLQPGKPIPNQSQEGRNKQRKGDRAGQNFFADHAEKIFKGIAIGMLLLVAVFIVLQLRKKYFNKQLPLISPPLSPEEAAVLSQQSLRGHILEAERMGDFGTAIRFLYLSVLQALQRGAWIEWKKEKTNREYCIELKDTSFSGTFQFATRFFDRACYGDYLPDEHQYRQEIAPVFNTLLEDIEKTKPGILTTGSNPPDYA